MNVPSQIPKKMRIKWKKCLQSIAVDTPDGTTEESTLVPAVSPSTLADPGDAVDTGGYPKLAAMTLWYDKYRPYESWVGVDIFSTEDGPLEAFSYWSDNVNARHATTNNKSQLCTIPRIKFKKFADQKFSGGSRKLRIFRKIKTRDLFPRFDVNAEKLSTTITDADGPTEQPFFHVGVCSGDHGFLENKIVTFVYTVGCSTILYRRDEIINPS